jgi:hypothetical protein
MLLEVLLLATGASEDLPAFHERSSEHGEGAEWFEGRRS